MCRNINPVATNWIHIVIQYIQLWIQFRQKETRKYLHTTKTLRKNQLFFSVPRFKVKFDKPSFHLQSSRTLSKLLIESPIRRKLSNFHASRHHRYHTRVHRSIDRSIEEDKEYSRLSKRKREKRERVPRPILDRNEANGRRIVGPAFRAGNFSYARFRGKNKTGCRKRNERRSSPPGGHLPVYRRHALSARYGEGRKGF